MLTVSNTGVVRLTRGDTAELEVTISKADGSAYEMQPDDKLIFSVKKTIKSAEYDVQKIVTGSNVIHIDPADTANMAFANYLYDVELRTAAGAVYTVIPPTGFEIATEVTCGTD